MWCFQWPQDWKRSILIPIPKKGGSKECSEEEQDGGGIGGHRVQLSPQIHQEYTFRQKWLQNSSWGWAGVAIIGKEYVESCKTWQHEGTRGKNRSVSRTGSAIGGWGNWSRGPIPTLGQLSGSEEKRLKLRVKQLICDSVNGMRIRESLPQSYT